MTWLRLKLRYLSSRWPLADLLNRLSTTCWCDLVMWALSKDHDRREDRTKLRDVLSKGATRRCRIDAAEMGNCYCAKFRTAEFETRTGVSPGVIVDPTSERAS